MNNFGLNLIKKMFGSLICIILLQTSALAASISIFTVGAQGYDVVGYFADNKAEKGDTDFVVNQNGINYLFINLQHKAMFMANPDKYLPQYGGWCAFGVSVGKKIAADPLAWKVINGKLYFNLNLHTQAVWLKDTAGYIQKADANWIKIKDVNPTLL